MNLTKIIGWFTFLAGICIVLFTLYSSYNIFTGKMDIPEIFRTSGFSDTFNVQGDETGALPVIIGAIRGIFPSDAIQKFLNLAVWMMLAGILIFGGTQIANLGIKLIKIPSEPRTSRRKNLDSNELKTSV